MVGLKEWLNDELKYDYIELWDIQGVIHRNLFTYLLHSVLNRKP